MQSGGLGAGGLGQLLSRPSRPGEQVRDPQPARNENGLNQQTPRDQLVHPLRGSYCISSRSVAEAPVLGADTVDLLHTGQALSVCR